MRLQKCSCATCSWDFISSGERAGPLGCERACSFLGGLQSVRIATRLLSPVQAPRLLPLPSKSRVGMGLGRGRARVQGAGKVFAVGS